MSDPPTLVFVPGSWHRPTCYNKIIKLLQEQHNLKCTTVTLLSTSGDPEATFKDDIDAAREAIDAETSQGRNVVVVAHSFGGMVANSAIKGFTAKDVSSPASGHVIGLVLIASGFTLTGLSFMDPMFGIPPPTWRVNKETGFAELVTPPRQLFYHDLPGDEADEWVSQLTPQNLKALFEGGEHAYAGWQDVPVWYIGTVEDQGLPVAMQRLQVGMAREMGGAVEHRELQTSHSPFLSQPNEVVDILTDAIAAFTGKAVEVSLPEQKERAVVRTPRADIWQPHSMLKYGLPLALGHIVGRCIVLFQWTRGLWTSKSKTS